MHVTSLPSPCTALALCTDSCWPFLVMGTIGPSRGCVMPRTEWTVKRGDSRGDEG